MELQCILRSLTQTGRSSSLVCNRSRKTSSRSCVLCCVQFHAQVDLPRSNSFDLSLSSRVYLSCHDFKLDKLHGGPHSFCANLTHFEVGSHSSEAADLDRSAFAYVRSVALGNYLSVQRSDKLFVLALEFYRDVSRG